MPPATAMWLSLIMASSSRSGGRAAAAAHSSSARRRLLRVHSGACACRRRGGARAAVATPGEMAQEIERHAFARQHGAGRAVTPSCAGRALSRACASSSIRGASLPKVAATSGRPEMMLAYRARGHVLRSCIEVTSPARPRSGERARDHGFDLERREHVGRAGRGGHDRFKFTITCRAFSAIAGSITAASSRDEAVEKFLRQRDPVHVARPHELDVVAYNFVGHRAFRDHHDAARAVLAHPDHAGGRPGAP